MTFEQISEVGKRGRERTETTRPVAVHALQLPQSQRVVWEASEGYSVCFGLSGAKAELRALRMLSKHVPLGHP